MHTTALNKISMHIPLKPLDRKQNGIIMYLEKPFYFIQYATFIAFAYWIENYIEQNQYWFGCCSYLMETKLEVFSI